MTFRCKWRLGHCSSTGCDYPFVQCLKSPTILVGLFENLICLDMSILFSIQKWGNLFILALEGTCFGLYGLILNGSSVYLEQTKDLSFEGGHVEGNPQHQLSNYVFNYILIHLYE